MTPALIVIAILGCSDAGDACQTVRTEPTQFVSVAECNAAAEATLTRFTGLSYPVVAVRCQKAATPVMVSAALTPAG